MPIIQVDEIQEITQSALRAAGATDDEAEIVGDHLVQSSLAGHDSHGIMRALQYAEMIQSGEIIPGTAPTVELDTPVFCHNGCDQCIWLGRRCQGDAQRNQKGERFIPRTGDNKKFTPQRSPGNVWRNRGCRKCRGVGVPQWWRIGPVGGTVRWIEAPIRHEPDGHGSAFWKRFSGRP